MPSLVRFMIHHLAIGFAIGVGAALLLIYIQPQRIGSQQALAIWLYIFSLGAPLALGSLASALLSENGD